MGLRILAGYEAGRPEYPVATMFCATKGVAFGPVIEGDRLDTDQDVIDQMEGFIEYVRAETKGKDPRSLDSSNLMFLFGQWFKLGRPRSGGSR